MHLSLTTIPKQQQLRNFQSCVELSSHLWSDVALDYWSAHGFIRALRRACLMTGRQECHRVFALSRRSQARERKCVLPRLFALLHWPSPPLWCFLDLRRVSCSPEIKSFLLSMRIDAPESTTHSRSSGFFKRGYQHYPCFVTTVELGLFLVFELRDTFHQVPCFSADASFLLTGFFSCSFLELGAHGLRS